MFETERCVTSVFQEFDSADVLKLFSNLEVRKYLGGVRELDSIKATLDDMLAPEKGFFYWVVKEKSTTDFIGLISLDLHQDGIDYEMSYQLLPEWWGKGYALESASVIIDYALKELQLAAVVAETQSANEPSRKLLEKLGMKLEKKVFRYGAEQSIYAIRCLEREDEQGLSKAFIE